MAPARMSPSSTSHAESTATTGNGSRRGDEKGPFLSFAVDDVGPSVAKSSYLIPSTTPSSVVPSASNVVPRTLCELLGILRERRRAQVLRMLGELRRSRELRGNVSDATYQESVLRFPVITRRSSSRLPRMCCLVVDQAIRTRSAAVLGCNCEAQRTGREVPHSRPHRGR